MIISAPNRTGYFTCNNSTNKNIDETTTTRKTYVYQQKKTVQIFLINNSLNIFNMGKKRISRKLKVKTQRKK